MRKETEKHQLVELPKEISNVALVEAKACKTSINDKIDSSSASHIPALPLDYSQKEGIKVSTAVAIQCEIEKSNVMDYEHLLDNLSPKINESLPNFLP